MSVRPLVRIVSTRQPAKSTEWTSGEGSLCGILMVTDLFTKPVGKILYEDLEQFARSGPIEGDRLDWKIDLRSARVTETIAAMVNTAGGLILIGVDEKQDAEGRTKGMEWPPRAGVPASVLDALVSTCRAYLRPSNYVPHFHPVKIPHLPDRYVVVVRVDQAPPTPRYVWHLERGFLERIGDQNRPASPETVATLLSPAGNDEQDRLYDEWRLFSSRSDGILQDFLFAMRYPRPALAFGTTEKKALQAAFQAHYGWYPRTVMRPRHDFVAFERTFAESPDDKLMVWFSSLGVVRISWFRTLGSAIPWSWIVGELMIALDCMQCDHAASVFPNVSEGELDIRLGNWPNLGIDTKGLCPAPDHATEHLEGRFVDEHYVVESPSDHWEDIGRPFMEHVLAEMGCMEYENHLNSFRSKAGIGLKMWLHAYRQAGRG